jgi:hypothetical protein
MTSPVNPALQPVAFNVVDYIDTDQLTKDITFSPNDLTTAMIQQASLFAHYGILHAKAQRQVDTVKLLLENTESAIYKMIRDEMNARSEKFTETLLEKLISRNSRVVGMKKALNEARRVEAVCKISTEAFRHRRDMLIQQGLISREEMKGELAVKEKSVRDDAAESLKQRFMERRLKSGDDENS